MADNAILIQNVTLDDLERMIDRAVARRVKEFYEQVQVKKPRMVKRKEAAYILGVSLVTLDRYARCGILHAQHIGGRVFFEEAELQSINGR